MITNLYRCPFTEAYTALLVDCVTGKIASLVEDDHSRVSIDIIYNNVDDYIIDFENWKNNILINENMMGENNKNNKNIIDENMMDENKNEDKDENKNEDKDEDKNEDKDEDKDEDEDDEDSDDSCFDENNIDKYKFKCKEFSGFIRCSKKLDFYYG